MSTYESMKNEMNRRDFVKGTLLSSAGLALGLGAGAEGATPATPPNALPKGRIGKLEVSRVILGGNLLTHYTHSRDLQYVYDLAAHYNTDEKIFETLAAAEANGINTVSMHDPPHPISLLRRYRQERGGKIQWIICPTASIEPGLDKYKRAIEGLVKSGCEAIYLWGVFGDALANEGNFDLMGQAVEAAKAFGVPSGVGCHALDVVKGCEKNGIKADFYIKTFHHHKYPTGPKPEQLKAPYNEFPGYWCRDPEETIEVMKAVTKPWIAFKTMAAGAIPPKDAFNYAFLNGADFVLAGMFDYEVAKDVKIAQTVLTNLSERKRAWKA